MAQFDPNAFTAQLRQATDAAEAIALIEPLDFSELKVICKRLGIRHGDLTAMNDLRHRLIGHLSHRPT